TVGFAIGTGNRVLPGLITFLQTARNGRFTSRGFFLTMSARADICPERQRECEQSAKSKDLVHVQSPENRVRERFSGFLNALRSCRRVVQLVQPSGGPRAKSVFRS